VTLANPANLAGLATLVHFFAGFLTRLIAGNAVQCLNIFEDQITVTKMKDEIMGNVTQHVPKVGAPDPELKNSPIFDNMDDDDLSLDLELESGACYFNGVSYTIGSYVCSGNELLRCEERGVWFREGTCYQD
jgi:hypothetical protein